VNFRQYIIFVQHGSSHFSQKASGSLGTGRGYPIVQHAG